MTTGEREPTRLNDSNDLAQLDLIGLAQLARDKHWRLYDGAPASRLGALVATRYFHVIGTLTNCWLPIRKVNREQIETRLIEGRDKALQVLGAQYPDQLERLQTRMQGIPNYWQVLLRPVLLPELEPTSQALIAAATRFVVADIADSGFELPVKVECDQNPNEAVLRAYVARAIGRGAARGVVDQFFPWTADY